MNRFDAVNILNSKSVRKQIDFINSPVCQAQINEALKISSYINFDDFLLSAKQVNYFTKEYDFFQRNYSYYQQFVENIKSDEDLYISNESQICIKSQKDISLPISTIDAAILINKLVKKISASDAFLFVSYLSKYPMLGLTNSIGVNILEAIKELKSETIDDIDLYRIMKPYKINRPYVEDEMYKSPFLYTPQGRFSNTGLNYSYFAENFESAKKEIALKKKDKYTYIHVKLKKPLRIINICDLSVPIFKLCHQSRSTDSSSLEINYLLSNYISNCISLLGYDGIISLCTKNIKNKNYIFFNICKSDFELIELNHYNFYND